MMIDVITTCPICKKETIICVESSDFEAWQNGTLIQDAMWYLSPEERESLISGICPKCWDKMFSFEDEDYEPNYDLDAGFDPYEGDYTWDC